MRSNILDMKRVMESPPCVRYADDQR